MSSPQLSKGKRSRTFTGCLTCRRRKVKCPDPTHPCRTCTRLRLDCISPFSSNLRSATITARPLPPQGGPVPKHHTGTCSLSASPSPSNSAQRPQTRQTPKATVPNYEGLVRWTPVSEPWDETCPPFPDETMFFDSLVPQDDVQDMLLFPGLDPLDSSQAFWSPGGVNNALEATPSAGTPEDKAMSAYHHGPSRANQFVACEDNEISRNLYRKLMGKNVDLCSPDSKASAISHFKGHLATTLSVKSVKWNIFTYLLGHRDRYAPIGRSIVALAAAHEGLGLRNDSIEYMVYYAQASADFDHLLESLEDNGCLPGDQLETTLATDYLLCHCDIIVCNASRLSARLERTRAIIQRQWHLLSSNLSGVSARLILWLGYLDVRLSMLSQHEVASSELLLSIIGKFQGLPQLYLSSRLYLKEAFGESYPSSELQHDMMQDPVNLKYIEAMTALGRILQHGRVSSTASCTSTFELDEERDLLYLRLVELQRECNIALQGFDADGSVVVTRTSYHWLSLKAINNSGLILLDRLKQPQIRTSKEAQHAAHEILNIVRTLRKANKLHNPHSVFSLLPIFIAGIETTDEIYQDWVRNFLTDASNWGLHVQEASRSLHCILELQGQTRRRLSLSEIAKLASTQLIL